MSFKHFTVQQVLALICDMITVVNFIVAVQLFAGMSYIFIRVYEDNYYTHIK